MVKKEIQQNNIVIYTPKKGPVDFRVRVEKETVWLSQKDMELFRKNWGYIKKFDKKIFPIYT